MWTELCQEKISLVSRGKARVLTLAQLFCISKDVRWERKWRVWNDDGPGTGWWDKHRRESRPPSSSSSCLALISSTMSQLLFPASPGIHLVPSVVLYFLQKPPERLQMSPAVWMPSVSLRILLASRHQGRTSSRGFKSSQPKMKRTPTGNTNKHETATSFDTFQAFAMGVHSLQPLPHILSANAKSPCIRHMNVHNIYRHGLHLSVSTALICLCIHGFR